MIQLCFIIPSQGAVRQFLNFFCKLQYVDFQKLGSLFYLLNINKGLLDEVMETFMPLMHDEEN